MDPNLDTTLEDGPGDAAARCGPPPLKAPCSCEQTATRVRAECAAPFVTEDGASDTPCQCSAVIDLLAMSRDFGVSKAYDPASQSYCNVVLMSSIG